MVSLCSFTSFACDNLSLSLSQSLKPSSLPLIHSFTLPRNTIRKKNGASVRPLFCALNNNNNNTALQYRTLGDSDLNISEITLGTVSFFSFLFDHILNYSFVFFLFDWLVPRCCCCCWLQMTFGEQNTEKEAHDILNYAFDRGINALDTAEAVSLLFIQSLSAFALCIYILLKYLDSFLFI